MLSITNAGTKDYVSSIPLSHKVHINKTFFNVFNTRFEQSLYMIINNLQKNKKLLIPVNREYLLVVMLIINKDTFMPSLPIGRFWQTYKQTNNYKTLKYLGYSTSLIKQMHIDISNSLLAKVNTLLLTKLTEYSDSYEAQN